MIYIFIIMIYLCWHSTHVIKNFINYGYQISEKNTTNCFDCSWFISCFWFSSLVSKESNLRAVYSELKHFKAIEVVTLPMGQGNKTSRVVAWTFLTPEEQIKWKKDRW